MWLGFNGIEKDDSGGGAIGRHTQIAKREIRDDPRIADRTRRAGLSRRSYVECRFGEAFPRPVAIDVEFKDSDPVMQEFRLVGECD